ncbi:MAG: Stk1 family PASTA domain-containing Ser/Thr kinase [Clostridia bacterium]|nr:Stk1 family PASTA domain-containing Ser/Thr kinase [Clostridia bacterium]
MDKILAERYRLTEQIGIGGMAIVYKALDMRTGHNVAVKVLRPEYNRDAEFVSRFQREAEAASKMTHHNIVNLLDVGMDGENRYLVMEYVQGKTLKEVIRERGRLSAPLACQITIRILSALEHAHRNGIIHRDIKPQNILVHSDGHVKVSDFGIARIADSATLTRGDNVMGSVHYFSPEQARGETVNLTSDLYSTGVVLYEMLTGRVPYDGDNPVAVAMQHIHGTPVPIREYAPDVPVSVANVCMKAMEKDPNARYQSAREMASDLRLAMEQRGVIPVNPDKQAEEVKLPKPQISVNTNGNGSEKNTAGGKKNIKRRRMIILTTLCTLAVITVLFFGGWFIYQKVMTSATVPEVIGYTLEEAQRLIARQNLKSEVVIVNHDEYAEGTVMMQTPEENTTLRKGDTVVLTVSGGPAGQTMPQVTGMIYQDALTLLQQMGLPQVAAKWIMSAEIPQDTVISQQPETGTTVYKGNAVELTVSGGVAIVPNLVGVSLADAEAMINAGSLALNGVLQYADTDEPARNGLIASQVPAAETQTSANATVTLTVYRCPAVVRNIGFTLDIPQNESGSILRVTLQAENTQTEYQIMSLTCDESNAGTRNIPIELPDERNYYCNVYLNDTFMYRQLLQEKANE